MNLHLLHLEGIQLLLNSLSQHRREPIRCRRFTPPIINGCRECIIDRQILRKGYLLAQSWRTGSLGDRRRSVEHRRQYRGRRVGCRVCIGERWALVRGSDHILVIGDRLGAARRTTSWRCSVINLRCIQTLRCVRRSVEIKFQRWESKCSVGKKRIGWLLQSVNVVRIG